MGTEGRRIYFLKSKSSGGDYQRNLSVSEYGRVHKGEQSFFREPSLSFVDVSLLSVHSDSR